MNHDDLERLLADSLDRQARESVGERHTPPRPRFLDKPAATGHRRHVVRVLAPLSAAAAVVAVVVGIAAVQHGSKPATRTTAAAPPIAVSPTAAPSRVTGPHTAVRVRLVNAEHSVVGIGMPVVAYFSQLITDARPLAAATRLAINGKPATGAWYFERSTTPGYPIEGHFRMSSYWPARAKISVQLRIMDLPAGTSGGTTYAYADNLSLAFSTGAAQVVTVDDAQHELVLKRDGRTVETAPVSLGMPSTPTLRGTKVIMRKGKDIAMSGPGYSDPHVLWTQQLTYSGEYLHAAPWNTYNIDHGIDSSNGCTNLTPTDAERLYRILRVGDVVQYPDASGPRMSLGEGYGDWNVPWQQWLTGGAVRTS